MVLSKVELERAGSVNIRNKYENFQNLHQQLGESILPAVSLLPTFNDTTAIVFSCGVDDKAQPTYNTLLSHSPLNNLEEYLHVVLQALHLVWKIHKLEQLCTNMSPYGLVVRSESGVKYMFSPSHQFLLFIFLPVPLRLSPSFFLLLFIFTNILFSNELKVQLLDINVSDNNAKNSSSSKSAVNRAVDVTIDYKYTSPEFSGNERRRARQRREESRK